MSIIGYLPEEVSVGCASSRTAYLDHFPLEDKFSLTIRLWVGLNNNNINCVMDFILKTRRRIRNLKMRVALVIALQWSINLLVFAEEHDQYFKVHLEDPTTLSRVSEVLWDRGQSTKMRLKYPNVLTIGPHLFEKEAKITLLEFYLADKLLNIDVNSFDNLPRLKRLEINRGIVPLKESMFRNLHQLSSLRLAVDEKAVKLRDVLLKDLRNLMTLEILNANKVNLCLMMFARESNIYSIAHLEYHGGQLQTLQELAFQCLPNLETLKIVKTNLHVLQTYAFGRLGKLQVLELNGNRNLTHIPAYTLNDFEALETLILTDNQINMIDEAAFRNLFNKLELLDLRGNNIRFVQEKWFDKLNCSELDLRSNPMRGDRALARNSFANSQIDEIYMSSEVYGTKNFHRLGLQKNKTTIYYQRSEPGWEQQFIIRGKDGNEFLPSYLQDPNRVCEKCHESEDFRCCTKNDTQLVDVTAYSGTNQTDLILTEDITSIEADAIVDTTINRLAIVLSDSQQLTIQPHAFDLPNLRILQIMNGPVVIQRGMFASLKSLTSLEMQAQKSETKFCQVLQEVPTVESLKIHQNQMLHDICHEECDQDKPSVKTLTYIYGKIDVVLSNSLVCLKALETLDYHRTRINFIETGAFSGLRKLTSLSFYHNGLHQISATVFAPLVSLTSLHINDFIFTRFDGNDFKEMVADKRHYSDYSDELFIGLDCQQLLKFSPMNIYRDDLDTIIFENDEIIFETLGNRTYPFNSVSRISLLSSSVFPVIGSLYPPNSLSDVNFGDHCRETASEPAYQVCTQEGITLASVKLVNDADKPVHGELEVYEDGVSYIKRDAFHNLTLRTLLLRFSNAPFLRARPESFRGLSQLDTLILQTGPLKLIPNLFNEFKSLTDLQLSYRPWNTELCQLLPSVPKLTSLLIFNHTSVDICNKDRCGNQKYRISNLEYVSGDLVTLKENSFSCLQSLTHLTITETNIVHINLGAFDGLENLQVLKLTHNSNLRFIPGLIFDNLISLTRLFLQSNAIELIGIESFKFSLKTNLTVLDLRSNNLSVIEPLAFSKLRCGDFHLSFNSIREIRTNAFFNSEIKNFYWMNNQNVQFDRPAWGLDDSTKVYLNGKLLDEGQRESVDTCIPIRRCHSCKPVCIN